MKNILGLDLGTNSIGWSVIQGLVDESNRERLMKILGCGSRIIPMSAAILGDFDRGNSISQTAERTGYRGVRRLRERELLRRERLHRVLDILGFLPEHYAALLTRYGKFKSPEAGKIAWTTDESGNPKFLFEDSFLEMLHDFAVNQPALVSDGKKVPYDWTVYYLRKKALTQKISKEELAWLLLNFNQKRGYYQLRGEEEESETEEKKPKTRQYFDRQIIKSITDTGDVYRENKIFMVELANGEKGKIFKREKPDWEGQEKAILVTVDLDKEGNDRLESDGSVSRRYKIPTEAEWDTQWALIKMKTEQDLDNQSKTVGAYIYDTLLQRPNQKIRGKLVRTIERKYYKQELIQILKAQTSFHEELRDEQLYKRCIEELYGSNDSYRNSISGRDFVYLFVDNILFYQRPLKSKKSLIDDCPYESLTYKKDGEVKEVPLKCIAKSHPLFQEFRLWQFISNIRIYLKEGINPSSGRKELDIDVTSQFLPDTSSYERLFNWLNEKKEVDQNGFLKYPAFNLKKEVDKYRWNYVEDKKYPCNSTHAQLVAALQKAGVPSSFLDEKAKDGESMEEVLWNILYAIEDKQELEKAVSTFAQKHDLPDSFVTVFKHFPPYKKEYGSYSAKAIRKLLSVMRLGSRWSENGIDPLVLDRINKLIDGEWDEQIDDRTREKAQHLKRVEDFSGLPVWLACYVVYGRHSEAKEIQYWKKPEDIDAYLKSFRQHSLRNPIVEQVVLETLRTVRDIWKQVGQIDEIHVELGREMKNPADKRRKETLRILENENANLRIKALLTEFMNPEFEIENVRPYSPSQQDLLRIYEEGVFDSELDNIPDDIKDILKKFNQADITKQPTHGEVMRYKLWLEQKYCSPYTNKPIPLGKLFTSAYEIEHVIPQSRYFDNSLNNKVICESEVNKLKDNSLGYEFIKNHHGEIVTLTGGQTVRILSVKEYEQFVDDHYSKNRIKKRNLLLEDIPEDFISRQLNDSRYISKLIKGLLSNIVREENEPEAVSKNLISCTGGITDRLKKDWGINDIWNDLILPRFQRMNELEGSKRFTTFNKNGKEIPAMPLELQKGFSKKRIDHRHHAMDAIVIACANRNIVNYLNNASASKNAKTTRYDLQHLLCSKCKNEEDGGYQWLINKPWENFTADVLHALSEIVVSFKQNLRVINKTSNRYQHINEEGKKVMELQTKGDSWAIRKPMHKETVFGEVNLQMKKTENLKKAIEHPERIVNKALRKEIKAMLTLKYSFNRIKEHFDTYKDKWKDTDLNKVEVYIYSKETKDRYFATRKVIDVSFDEEKIKGSVTDTGIQKIMLRHLEANQNNPKLAFSPDGIEEMNRNIVALNGGKPHQPIYRVRVYEMSNSKFSVGETGNKTHKYVEAAKGTNLFFAIYETEVIDKKTGAKSTKRSYDIIPLNVVVERQKQGLPSAPCNEEGIEPKYVLSPNDLVYLPTAEEVETGNILFPIDKNRIYRVVSFGAVACFCVKSEVASLIKDKVEYTSQNKMERAITGEMIKDTCIPIIVDRLGNIRLKK